MEKEEIFKSSSTAKGKAAEAKPSKKGGFGFLPTFLRDKEVYLIVGMIVVLLGAVGGITFLLWTLVKPLFVWVFAFLLIFLTRRTDLWYMGLEVHYFLAFALGYVFGPWFATLLIFGAFYLVFRARPDQLHGVFIQGLCLVLVALSGFYFGSHYGASIAVSRFVLIAMGTIIIAQILDGFLSITFCPAPPFKVFIVHTLDIVINYFLISLVGLKILHFLFSMI